MSETPERTAVEQSPFAAKIEVPQNQPPTCCKDKMFMMMRRAILHYDGQLGFAAVWHCLMCGRLVH